MRERKKKKRSETGKDRKGERIWGPWRPWASSLRCSGPSRSPHQRRDSEEAAYTFPSSLLLSLFLSSFSLSSLRHKVLCQSVQSRSAMTNGEIWIAMDDSLNSSGFESARNYWSRERDGHQFHDNAQNTIKSVCIIRIFHWDKFREISHVCLLHTHTYMYVLLYTISHIYSREINLPRWQFTI